MPPDKIKLLPESVLTFLEVGLKHSLDKQKSAPEEQKKLSIYNFVKMLCISNSYLYYSCRANFDIYRLSLRFNQNSDSILVSLALKDYGFFGENRISLTYGSVHKLIKILLPSYIGASFTGNITDTNMFDQSLKLLQLTKGKLGFYLDSKFNEEFAQTLLVTFASRTYELVCFMNQFEAIESLEFPVFDRLFVYLIANSGQVSRILKCKAKELNFFSAGRNFTIDDSDLVNLKNETVKKLDLEFFRFDYIKFEKLVGQLQKSCMNLKHFCIVANFVHRSEFSINQVHEQVIAYVKRMEDLKSRFGNGLASMSIKFVVIIGVYGQRDKTWTKTICDKPEYKHWKINSHEVDSIDVLEMKFDKAGCNLKLTVKVLTQDLEVVNAAFNNGGGDHE